MYILFGGNFNYCGVAICVIYVCICMYVYSYAHEGVKLDETKRLQSSLKCLVAVWGTALSGIPVWWRPVYDLALLLAVRTFGYEVTQYLVTTIITIITLAMRVLSSPLTSLSYE